MYFLYDRSNIIKRAFTDEINKLSPIYCSGCFYGETEKEKIDLITGKNAKSFFIDKSAEKKELDLQIAKVSGKKTETTDNKIHNVFFFFSRIGKKKKDKNEYNRFYQHQRSTKFFRR